MGAKDSEKDLRTRRARRTVAEYGRCRRCCAASPGPAGMAVFHHERPDRRFQDLASDWGGPLAPMMISQSMMATSANKTG